MAKKPKYYAVKKRQTDWGVFNVGRVQGTGGSL